MRVLRMSIVGGILLGALILSLGSSAGAASPFSNITTSKIYTIPMMDAEGNMLTPIREIEGSRATLFTTKNSASAWLTTSELTVGHAISVWWIIFNDPENCIDGCDDHDYYNNAEATGASMIGSVGTVVRNADETKFFSFIEAYDESIAVEGPGLQNPMGAEIHMVLRTHGPARPHILMEQVTTYMGGCHPEPPHVPCRDIQFSVHKQ